MDIADTLKLRDLGLLRRQPPIAARIMKAFPLPDHGEVRLLQFPYGTGFVVIFSQGQEIVELVYKARHQLARSRFLAHFKKPKTAAPKPVQLELF